MYLQITRREITPSSRKRDKKSKSHVGMKLAPVRVFSCKHPLTGGGHLLQVPTVTMTGKILVFWIGGHFWEVVAYGSQLHMEVPL